MLDDEAIQAGLPHRVFLKLPSPSLNPLLESKLKKGVSIGLFVVIFTLTVTLEKNRLISRMPHDSFLSKSLRGALSLHIVGGYGLFAVMTTERNEIRVEGSRDGQTWIPYAFRWKPQDVNHAPKWAQPHQPRLDWQMWFAALSGYEHQRWFLFFLQRLLEGSPDVLSLLERDPFEGIPPRYIRAVLEEYTFTDIPTLWKTGRWWNTEKRGAYTPVLSLFSL